jgi:hypothetical protein
MYLHEAPAARLVLSSGRSEVSQHIELLTEHLIVAGWTGRDPAAVEAHIKELELIGIARPIKTPMFYRVSASLVTMANSIQVIGQSSTGEAEIVLFCHEDKYWITIGSDHTDRKAETIGVTLSKQLCPKPIASEAWAMADIEAHWDKLILRSFAESNGNKVLYQEGKLSSMSRPQDLVEVFSQRTGSDFQSGALMFCGTLAVRGEIRWADVFSIELEDPVLERKMTHTYTIESLPIED